jgi:hypothetical protein
MTADSSGDRETEIQRLLDGIQDCEAVADAWTAKSFTDLLLVVDVREGAELPAAVEELLEAHGFRGANEVYETTEQGSFVGSVPTGTRHQFVDVQTRGAHQSYVIEE